MDEAAQPMVVEAGGLAPKASGRGPGHRGGGGLGPGRLSLSAPALRQASAALRLLEPPVS